VKTTEISLGERIRQVRQGHRLTQKAFADSLGIAQGFLSSLESGRKVPSDTLMIALTHLYRVEERWLATGDGEADPAEAPAVAAAPTPAAGLRPLLNRISPDFPHRLAPEDILGHIAWPGNSADGYALLAYGDFMAPTIQDNDLVLFRLGDDAKNGDIVLVTSKWGDVILRRYRVMDHGAWLSSDNSAYTPFQPAPHSRLLGIVTDVWRKVKL
jgi:transcriptional regulator with XRE-family HTH domain